MGSVKSRVVLHCRYDCKPVRWDNFVLIQCMARDQVLFD